MSANIKNLVNKNQYNLKIFELLVSDEYNSMLVTAANESLRLAFVQLISRSVLGPENEKTIALMLKESLTGKVVEINQNFVAQVFLPILNSFSKTPVCIMPYDIREDRLLFDTSSMDISSQGNKSSNTRNIKTSTFRLPSNILQKNNKD